MTDFILASLTLTQDTTSCAPGDVVCLTANAPLSDSPPPSFDAVRYAHATMLSIAFVIFFPLGAIGLHVLRMKNLVWYHAGWMVFLFMMVLAGLGMGVWMAVVSDQLDRTHSVIGIVVVACLFVQPFTGLAHHIWYKSRGRPNAATYPHIWWGRAIITLGIINGGLGLQLSGNTTGGEIAYGVVAGVMWLLWVAVVAMAFLKGRPEGEIGDNVEATKEQVASTDKRQDSESS